ncbi:hypothetical protein [Rickettsia tamurae]|nr:hypothetical protein [Rickettsia tamurae]
MGGGIYYDNLSDDKYAAYILREPLSESISLSNLLNKIDAKYVEL